MRIVINPNPFCIALVFLCGVLITAPVASASPRFTATNSTETKINVYIYAGNDSFCSFEEKLKHLSAGETDQYGCTGGGKGRPLYLPHGSRSAPDGSRHLSQVWDGPGA